MPTYYVGPQASFGSGTFANPYRLSQVDGVGSSGTNYIFFPGTYILYQRATVARRCGWYAYDLTNRPVFVGDADFANENPADYMIQGNIDGCILEGFLIDCDGHDLSGLSFSNSKVSKCKVISRGTQSVRAEHVSQCEIDHSGTQGAIMNTATQADSCFIKYSGAYNAAVYLAPNLTRSVVVGGSFYPVRSESCEYVVSRGVGRDAFYEANSQMHLSNCISWDSREFTTWDTGGPANVVDCFEYSSTNASPASYTGLTTLTDDIFVDFLNNDLRLTTYGKTIQGVKNIMAQLVNVPGITTDSLADLVGSGGGGGGLFDPLRGGLIG